MDITDALKTEAYDKKQPWGDTQTASLMENLKGGLNSAVPNTIDKNYGVPFGAVAVAVVYNKNIYSKVGITAPSTFDEFLSNNDKLKAAGYIPMSFVGKFGWDSWWYRIAASQYMPEIKSEDFASGKAKFTDPNFVKGLTLVQDMWKRGHFDPGGFTNGAEETQALFVQGKLAQYLVVPENFVTYLMNNSPKDVQLDAFVLPGMNPATKNLAIGGAANVISIKANTQVKDAAIKLAKYMTSEKMYQLLAPEGVVPSTTGYTPPEGNTVMKAFADAMAEGFFVDNTPIASDSKLTDKMEKELMPNMLLQNEAPAKIAAELQAQYDKNLKK
jgi:raffinose/stachyose/melibiose transport system substrate-binding protein